MTVGQTCVYRVSNNQSKYLFLDGVSNVVFNIPGRRRMEDALEWIPGKIEYK